MESIPSENTPILSDGPEPTKHTISRKHCVTVEPAAVLSIIYLAGITPWTQQYVYYRLGTDQHLAYVENHTLCLEGQQQNDSNYLIEEDVQRTTSYKLATYNAATLFPLLCSSIIIGTLSDNFGRKPALMIPVIGAFSRMAVTSCVVFFKLSLNYLYLAVIVESFLGGPMVFLGIIFAYLSDITTVNDRAFRIIAIEIFISIGVVTSMIGVESLIKYRGFLTPILVLTLFSVFNILYIIFFLHESLPRTNDDMVQFSKSWLTEIPKKALVLYNRDTRTGRRWRMLVSLLLFILSALGELGKMDVTVLYVLAHPFCFTPLTIAIFAAVSFLSSGIGAVAITKLLQRWLNEMAFYIIGSISSMASCILLGFANSLTMIFWAAMVNVFGRLQLGMLRSYFSKLVKKNEQGILFTSLGWFDQVAIVLGSVIFNIAYAGTRSIYAGFVFFLIAGIFVLTIVIAVVVVAIDRKQKIAKK